MLLEGYAVTTEAELSEAIGQYVRIFRRAPTHVSYPGLLEPRKGTGALRGLTLVPGRNIFIVGHRIAKRPKS